jgi:uncharacterized membrane protein
MKLFTKFGELIFKLFNFIGALIFEIPEVPNKLRTINSERFKENLPKVTKQVTITDKTINKKSDELETDKIEELKIQAKFSSKQKENTILLIQILSGAFLVSSIIYIFNFISFYLYLFASIILIGYAVYLLFTKIKLMYPYDFSAYRDFFLMYIVLGIILVLLNFNQNFVMSFSFQFFPNLSVLIFAIIGVLAVYLIFRIRYHRDFTFGKVIDVTEKTAYVKVDYDIRSNVTPDNYLVEKIGGVKERDIVKLQTSGNILSISGNKPTNIIEIVKKID